MYEYDTAVNAKQLASSGRSQLGQVSFSRSDGVAIVQISAALTPGAAKKLDDFLRELIAADVEPLASLQRDLMAAQRAAMHTNALSQTQGVYGGAGQPR